MQWVLGSSTYFTIRSITKYSIRLEHTETPTAVLVSYIPHTIVPTALHSKLPKSLQVFLYEFMHVLEDEQMQARLLINGPLPHK